MIYVACDLTGRLFAAHADNPATVRDIDLATLCRMQTPIRLCAQYRTSHVIVALLEAGRVVDLCAPNMYPDTLRHDPVWLVQAMAHEPPPFAASVGGFHRAGDVDLASYRLAAAARRNAGAEEIVALFNRHPLSSALTYLVGLNKLAAGMLIAYTQDPRWFVNPEAPSRCSRFTAFCGASPWRIARARQRSPKTHREWLTYYLVHAWAMADDCDAAADEPGGFLYRLPHRGSTRWLVNGSKKFCAMLHYCWLDEIHREQPSAGNRDPLFLPDMVLPSAESVVAFQHHLQVARACV